MFLIPGFVITLYVTNSPIPEAYRTEMIRYLCARAHPEDGGWGLHIEGESTIFGTSLNYVALRILGMSAEHPVARKARATLHKLGGALQNPHWGKLWLSVLNCYKYEGMNPVPPELWLLPKWVPFHPWRWWIHCRMVYLPMGYLYSKKWAYPANDLIKSLREEIYTQDFNTIDFSVQRNNIAPAEIYHPHSYVLDALNHVLVAWRKWVCPENIADWGCQHVYDIICGEDESSQGVDLGPVNNPMNTLVRYIHEGPDGEGIKLHRQTLLDYFWMKDEGMLVNGTDGVQVWDTSFYIQAIAECGLAGEPRYRDMLLRALEFLEDQQILEEPVGVGAEYRHTRKGAWPFSKKLQGYTVSDCTGEGLKSVLLLQSVPGFPKLVSDERLKLAVDILLSMQNTAYGNGFASYEKIRGGAWMEHLNAAEVFGGIMVEYNYPECTTAVVTALNFFIKYDPDYRREEIDKVLKTSVQFIRKIQRPDGSWYGNWGICFTYAAMFTMESLNLSGENYENSETVRKGCDFLIGKQMEDGGWGESFMSSVKQEYVHHKQSQVVMTAWACIALMHGEYPDPTPIKRGLKLIMSRQLPNGEWAQEAIEGVFNKSWYVTSPEMTLFITANVSQYDFVSQLQACLHHEGLGNVCPQIRRCSSLEL